MRVSHRATTGRSAQSAAAALLLLVAAGCSQEPDMVTIWRTQSPDAAKTTGGQVMPAASTGCPNDIQRAAEQRPANT